MPAYLLLAERGGMRDQEIFAKDQRKIFAIMDTEYTQS